MTPRALPRPKEDHPMIPIDDLVNDFLAQKRIAVAGVSGHRDIPANLIYRTLRDRGYTVYGINPHEETFLDDPCYRDIPSLPDRPDAVVIVTRPAVAEEIVRQCVQAGV